MTPSEKTLEPGFATRRRRILLAILERLVPGATALDEPGRAAVLATIDWALAQRPASMRRQLGLFVFAIDAFSFVTTLRPFHRLGPVARDRLLGRLERFPIALVRKGFWGLKALLLMGYFTRPAVRESIGYRPRLRGRAS